MNESEFNELAEATIEGIELALDDVDDDIDYELGGGVLTVKFTNGSSMVFSRQPPVQQLWLATKSGGYHFRYDTEASDWRDTRSGELFQPFVIAEMQDQGGVSLIL
jgi:CyaY protein